MIELEKLKFDRSKIFKNPEDSKQKEDLFKKERFVSKREKVDFIIKNYIKIAPVVENDAQLKFFLKEVIRRPDKKADVLLDEEFLDKLIEKFETKVFLLEKPSEEIEPGAKRVLLSASDPLSFQTMSRLIEQLKKDRRCREICLVTDGVAGRDFESLFLEHKDKVKVKSIKGGKELELGDNSDYNKDVPVFIDMLKATKEEPFDITITTVESHNTPSLPFLYTGKSIFTAEKGKLFITYDGWTGVSSRKDLFKNIGTDKSNMDSIDGIFCNDELAKRIIQKNIPNFSEDKIFITGTSIIDNLEINKADEYRENGREKLKLNENEIVVLYLGDINDDYKKIENIDPHINEKTFKETVAAMIKSAEQQPEKKFVLLVRPHPRDPNKEELLSYIETPKNLRIVPAVKDEVSLNESRYASDIVTSIISTENFLAPSYNRAGVFLSYKVDEENRQLGDKLLKNSFDADTIKIIKQVKNVTIASSPDEFVDYLRKYKRSYNRADTLAQKIDRKSSTEKMLDIMFTDLK